MKPSCMTGCILLDDTILKTYFDICPSAVSFDFKALNYFNGITVFYHLHGNLIVKVTYNYISASMLRSLRICPGLCSWMTRIIRQILTYACLQLDLSIPHQINLTTLLCFVIYMASYLTRSPRITSQPVG